MREVSKQSASSQLVMAFDFGLRYIGVAIGQPLTRQARGLATLMAKQGKPSWHELKALIEEYAPGCLIVGEPLHMDGESSQMSMAAQQFATILAKRYKIETVLTDERLTSRAAADLLEDAQALGTAKTIHEISACLIAEQYLRSVSEN